MILFLLVAGCSYAASVKDSFECFTNSTLQVFTGEMIRSCNTGFSWSRKSALCCVDSDQNSINIQTLSQRSFGKKLKTRAERILFVGESCTRGIFQDFVRIISQERKFSVNNHHPDPYCTVVRLKKKSIEACYTLIPGTLQRKWVNGINLTAYQENKLKEEPLQKLSRIFTENGAFSLVFIGMTTWDMLLVDRLDIYRSELLKLCEISKRYSKRVLIRSATPLGEPRDDFQGTSRGLTWNNRALLYNDAIRQVAAFENVQMLDLYDKMHEYAGFNKNLWQDQISWVKNYKRVKRECAKGMALQRICSSNRYPGNFLHFTCSKCDGSDGNGFFSSIFAQGILFYLLQ